MMKATFSILALAVALTLQTSCSLGPATNPNVPQRLQFLIDGKTIQLKPDFTAKSLDYLAVTLPSGTAKKVDMTSTEGATFEIEAGNSLILRAAGIAAQAGSVSGALGSRTLILCQGESPAFNAVSGTPMTISVPLNCKEENTLPVTAKVFSDDGLPLANQDISVVFKNEAVFPDFLRTSSEGVIHLPWGALSETIRLRAKSLNRDLAWDLAQSSSQITYVKPAYHSYLTLGFSYLGKNLPSAWLANDLNDNGKPSQADINLLISPFESGALPGASTYRGDNSALSALQITDSASSSVTLSPAFSPAHLVYSATLGAAIPSVSIQATPAHDSAKTLINGTSASSASIAVTSGVNTITVRGLAENGTDATTYTLLLTSPSATSVLSSMTPASGTFNPIPTSIVVTFSQSMATLANAQFSITGNCSTLPSVSSITMSGGGTIATATLTGASCSVGQTISVSLDPTSLTTATGSAGSGGAITRTYTFGAPPTLSSLTPASATLGSIPGNIIATFSQAMTAITPAQFVLSGTCATLPTVSGVTMSTGNTVATATLVGANCAAGETVIVTINPANLANASGISGTGAAVSRTYTFSAAPTLTTLTPNTGYFDPMPDTVVIGFDQAMSPLTVGSLGISGNCSTMPSVTSVTMSNGNTVATATLTAASCATGQSFTVSLNMANVTNASGVAGIGGVFTRTYSFSLMPSILSISPGSSLVNPLPATVSITFDQPVIAPTSSDISVTGTCTTLPTLSSTASMSAGDTIATFSLSGGACEADQTVTIEANSLLISNINGVYGDGTSVISTYTYNYCVGAALTNAPYAGGDGDYSTPYIICTAAQLDHLCNTPSDWTSASPLLPAFKVAADINLASSTGCNGHGSSPKAGGIGGHEATQPFTGTFDGGNHIISNFTYNDPTVNTVGFFNTTEGAYIKFVQLTNVTVSGNSYVGGLIGHAGTRVSGPTGTLVADSRVTGAVTGAGGHVGGLIGAALTSTVYSSVTHNSANVVVNGSGNFIGGLVGKLQNTSIEFSYATGSVMAAASSQSVGGLAGLTNDVIFDSYSTGTVTAGGNSSQVGGIVGTQGGNIQRCYTRSYVAPVTGGNYIGPIAGSGTGANVIDSHWSSFPYSAGEIAGFNNAYGNQQTDAALKNPATFVNWQTNVWNLTAGQYPTLK